MHKWSPCHREVLKRSHVDKTILLLQIGNRYVPIVETAVKMVDLEAENNESNAKSEANSKTEEVETSISLPPILDNESLSLNNDPLNVGPQSLNLRRRSSENQENKSLTEFPLQPL